MKGTHKSDYNEMYDLMYGELWTLRGAAFQTKIGLRFVLYLKIISTLSKKKILRRPRTASVACRRGSWMMQVNI